MSTTAKSSTGVTGVAPDALFALALEWDNESKRLFAEAKERWHLSDNLDLEHQAKAFRRCSAELQKLIRANALDQESPEHGGDSK